VFALLSVFLAPVASATPGEVRTLHMIRLNCDDEAERSSDEVDLFVNDQFFGARGDMDGGDWWPLHPELGIVFGDTIRVRFQEDDGLVFGDVTINTSEAFTGEHVLTWFGPQITGWRYRFTYFVD
jgi:hypothetical protein